MSRFRIVAVLLVLVLAWSEAPTAGPPNGWIAHWIEELGSDDADVWRPAVEHLWKAGPKAEPALRAALKHRDADVVLRARLILSRFDWGIFPDTPAAVVKAIERYRDGNQAERRTAAEELIKQGRPGYRALQRLLARETDAATRQLIAAQLKQNYRALVRGMLAGGDKAGAIELLETIVSAGNEEAAQDLMVLWVLSGEAPVKVKDLERKAIAGDRKAATRATHLYRAMGDLLSAKRVAQHSKDDELIGAILYELQDYKALAQALPLSIQNNPAHLAVVLHHAGDREGFESALARIPATNTWSRAIACFFCDRPRQALEEQRKQNYFTSICQLLATQGRPHDALALADDIEALKDASQKVGALLELAVVARGMGDKAKARDFFAKAIAGVEKTAPYEEAALGNVLRIAAPLGQRKEAFDEVARALDRIKPKTAPRSVLYALSERNSDVMVLWWDFLRRKSPETSPSATLTRLRDWFVSGKADKDFDALMSEAAPAKAATATAQEQDNWTQTRARTCLAVGRSKKAEEVLRAGAEASKTATAYSRLGDFHFDRKQWREAAAEYAKALERERDNVSAMYLRGIALVRLDQKKEGQALIERARLLPLADMAARYTLSTVLAQHGLREEATAENLLMMRSAPFHSVYGNNAASRLASLAVREKRFGEAARYYRRVYMGLAIGGGAFLDNRANLRVPAWAHLYHARALVASGKLDAALEEVRLSLVYLPDEISAVIDLVRAFDRASRKADADRLFDNVFAQHQRGCLGSPGSVDCHNKLAWLAVRCGRQLGKALKHARKATALAPEAAGCLDTLAEVLFQRGKKAEAIETMKRALKLAGNKAYYTAQLRRMEAGDRNAEVPEQ